MTFPLTHDEMKMIHDVKAKLQRGENFSADEYLRYQDIMKLLIDRNMVSETSTWGGDRLYTPHGDISAFEDWIKGENRKARKLSRRDWKIAIIAAATGAIIPEAVRLILYFFSK